MIITPEGIDIWSTIVWGIATAAIGGIIVVSVSGNLTPGRAISRTLIVFVACAIIWIGYYNVPGYSMFYLGNFVSSSQKNCSLGIDYWVRASKLQPRLGLAYLQIGQCYFLNGSYETAIEWLQAGKNLWPQQNILAQLGYVYASKADYDSAIRYARDALRLEPRSFDAQFLLGRTLHYQMNYKESLTELATAVALNPDSPATRFWYAWALYENGRYEEAIPHFQNAIRDNYNLSRSHAGLGFTNSKLQNYGIAVREFQTSLSLDSNQTDVQEALRSLQNK